MSTYLSIMRFVGENQGLIAVYAQGFEKVAHLRVFAACQSCNTALYGFLNRGVLAGPQYACAFQQAQFKQTCPEAWLERGPRPVAGQTVTKRQNPHGWSGRSARVPQGHPYIDVLRWPATYRQRPFEDDHSQ